MTTEISFAGFDASPRVVDVVFGVLRRPDDGPFEMVVLKSRRR